MQRTSIASWLLVIALASVFGIFGIEKFTTPLIWIGWIPQWMEGLLGMPRESWLLIIGAGEIFVALLVLIPVSAIRRTGIVLAILQLIGILTQTGWNDVAIRDMALLLSALALFFLTGSKKTETVR